MSETTAATSSPVGQEPPRMSRVVRDQRRTVTAALIVAVVGFWVFGPLGKWDAAVFFAVGVGLGLVNHLLTELSLLKIITSGDHPTRGEMTGQALFRLLFVAGAASAVAVIFWSTGLVTLIGLALFRLISLVMTTIPLLKELKKA